MDPAARYLSAALLGAQRRAAAQAAGLYGGGAAAAESLLQRQQALAATGATITASSYVGAPPLVTLPVNFNGVDASAQIRAALLAQIAVAESSVDQSAGVLQDLVQASGSTTQWRLAGTRTSAATSTIHLLTRG